MLTPIDKLIIQKQKLNDILDSRIVNDIENLHPEIDEFNTYWGIPNKHKKQHAISNTSCQSDSKDQKDKESTGWRSALVIQILCLLFLILVYFCNKNDLRFSAFILRPIIIFCSICCAIYWLYLCVSTYLKNGGNKL
jgi:amino acid permease